jgi:hypothetical protein
VNNPLLGDELEDASMGGGSRVLRVPKFEHPRRFKVKRSEMSESGWR